MLKTCHRISFDCAAWHRLLIDAEPVRAGLSSTRASQAGWWQEASLIAGLWILDRGS